MTLEEQFHNAAAESKALPEKPSNETLLQLYGLYKQGNDGDAHGDGPSNPFDFVAKAKHQAWAELKGKTKYDAMHEYVALVHKLKG